MRRKIICIVGARPNFMKSAPMMRTLREHGNQYEVLLVHTGQHYDRKLSQLFFEDLKMYPPDIYLGVGSGSHAIQTADIMVKLEKEFLREKPDLIIVFGDVNSTLAAAIVAAKLCIPIAHIEAGLRSFDNTMPEEINRIITDRLSDFMFVTERSALDNLKNEGVDSAKVFFSGNVMIDTLILNLEVAQRSDILSKLSLSPNEFATLTLHRPSNVDDKEVLTPLLDVLCKIGSKIPVVFPCHPRTRKSMEKHGMLNSFDNDALMIIEPLGYLDFLKLQSESKFVLTDSGGIQEETTYLGIPCITLRDNTERPITVDYGSNTLTGVNPDRILDAVNQIIDGNYKKSRIPELWDGKTSQRIVAILDEHLK